MSALPSHELLSSVLQRKATLMGWSPTQSCHYAIACSQSDNLPQFRRGAGSTYTYSNSLQVAHTRRAELSQLNVTKTNEQLHQVGLAAQCNRSTEVADNSHKQ
jgi:hypothetical protein